MDNLENARVDKGDQFAGYIFMCNSKTKPDCFMYRVFGLPASRIADAEKIKPSTKLFLFDFDVKLLYGPYVADSSGKLAIEPYAFGGRFPAQVKFSITRDCLPLPEVAFKEAIRENYYGGSKFKQGLSEEQVNKLASLFRPIALPSTPPPSSVYHNAMESPHPGHRGSSFQTTKFPTHGQYAARSDHINMQLHSSSYVQEVPFPPSHLPHNQVAVAGNHTLASQPFHSQPSYQQHDPAYVRETYHPDHPGLYQHETHARYGAVIPQIASTNSYYAPNPMPQTHISHQQSQVVVPSSTLAAAQWVAIASEAPQTLGGQTSSSGIPSSSNELQLPYNDYYGQTQGGSSVDNAYTYYNSGSSGATASEYQYQGYSYQTSHQVVHSITSVEVSGNAPAQVSDTHLTYQSQQLPVSQLSAAGVSSDLGPGYVPTYYAGANPTY